MPKSDMSLATLNVDMHINAHTYMYILYYYSGLISLSEYKAIKYFFFALLFIPNLIDVHDSYIILMSFSYFFFHILPPTFVVLYAMCHYCSLF